MGKRSGSADNDDCALLKRSRKKPRNHDSLRAEKSIEEKKLIQERRKARKQKKNKQLNSMPASSAALKQPAKSKISKLQLTAANNQSQMIKSLTAVATSTPIANHAPASVKSVKQEPAASSKVPPDTSSSDDSSSSDDETPKKVKSSATSDNVHMEDEQDYSEKSDSEKNCDGEKKSADGEKKSADGEKKSADGEKKSADGEKMSDNEKTGNDGKENSGAKQNSGEDISGDGGHHTPSLMDDDEQDDDEEDSSSSDESTDEKRPPKLSRQQHLAQLLHNKDDDGVIELIPGTGIYVDEDAFEMVVARKTNHTGLARNLLPLVFTNEALVNCSIKGQSQRGPLGATEKSRPGLYPDALEALLKKARDVCRKANVKRADPCHVIKQLNTKLSELRADKKKEEAYKDHLEKKKNKKKAKKDKSQNST